MSILKLNIIALFLTALFQLMFAGVIFHNCLFDDGKLNCYFSKYNKDELCKNVKVLSGFGSHTKRDKKTINCNLVSSTTDSSKLLRVINPAVRKNISKLLNDDVVILFKISLFMMKIDSTYSTNRVLNFVTSNKRHLDMLIESNKSTIESCKKDFLKMDVNTALSLIPVSSMLFKHNSEKIISKVAINGGEKSKNLYIGYWHLNKKDVVKMNSLGFSDKNLVEYLVVNDTSASNQIIALYFSSMYNQLYKNWYYVLIDFLCKNDKYITFYDLMRISKAKSFIDIKQYLDPADRKKINIFLMSYLYYRLSSNKYYNFNEDAFIKDVLITQIIR